MILSVSIGNTQQLISKQMTEEKKGQYAMSTEQQMTSTSNVYYDLVSVLYHALEASQTYATYVRDAQQTGDQQLVQFFQQVHRQNSQTAELAKQMLSQQMSQGSYR